jgi:alpha-galactosidase
VVRTFIALLLLCLTSLTTAAPDAPGPAVVSLSSLDLSLARQGFGQPHRDLSVGDHPLSIAGRKFTHGFGTHAVSLLDVRTNGATRFHAMVGVDDDAGPGRGSVEFAVLGDGKLLWSSGVMRQGEPAKKADIDLAGIKLIRLQVGDAADGFDFDHADWADASFDVSGEPPVAVPLPVTEPTIAPPVDDGPPRFNSRGQIAVTAESSRQSIDFRPAVSGARPMHFSADRLPADVRLDPATGQLSGGQLDQPPLSVSSPTTITATNAAGSASETFGFHGRLAQTPPMGWNSYDGYGDSVTEAETLANAKVVAEQFQPHGWQYVVVDYRWYDPGAHNNDPNTRAGVALTMDAFGRLQPSPNRFPSAASDAGFKPIADRVHAMGLKFGIHIMRGIPRLAVNANLPIAGSTFHGADAADPTSKCPWCPDMFGVRGETPAGQAWYDSIFKQYAEWGLDFVKVDDLSAPYATAEVAAIRRAIDKSGRSIVFSTSPGPAPLDRADHLVRNANLWRCTGDFWDDPKQLDSAMDTCAQWNGHGGPGHWPDMDMLPLGRLSVGGRSVGPDRRTRFSHAEQVTLLTMWSIFPSPLMVGGDLTAADDFQRALLLNDEVIAVNQDPLGRPAMRAERGGGGDVWSRELADGSVVIAVFNRTPSDAMTAVAWPRLGLYGAYAVRDLWSRKDLPDADREIVVDVPARGARMFRLQAKRTDRP